jgi:hypothetical protein
MKAPESAPLVTRRAIAACRAAEAGGDATATDAFIERVQAEQTASAARCRQLEAALRDAIALDVRHRVTVRSRWGCWQLDLFFAGGSRPDALAGVVHCRDVHEPGWDGARAPWVVRALGELDDRQLRDAFSIAPLNANWVRLRGPCALTAPARAVALAAFERHRQPLWEGERLFELPAWAAGARVVPDESSDDEQPDYEPDAFWVVEVDAEALAR